MESRLVPIIWGVLIVLCIRFTVEGAEVKFIQCNSQQSCSFIKQCSDYQMYFDKSFSEWPKSIRKQVTEQICDKSGKTYKICCKPFTSGGSGPTGKALLEKDCGKQSEHRIANGKIAEVYEFAWMALLLDFDGQLVCGGTLITKSHVLTAAHCIRKRIESVRLGENDLSKPTDCNNFDGEEDCADPPQDIPIGQRIPHPKYSVSRKKNDIALIRLQRPATLSFSVKTICLPLQPSWSASLPKSMLVSGWGITERGNQASNVLRYASVPLIELSQCSRLYKARSDVIALDATKVCAGGAADKQDNCRGDSGGPLQFFSEGPGGYVQHGVVAFGLRSCGKEALPGVYTKVSSYIDWILENLQ